MSPIVLHTHDGILYHINIIVSLTDKMVTEGKMNPKLVIEDRPEVLHQRMDQLNMLRKSRHFCDVVLQVRGELLGLSLCIFCNVVPSLLINDHYNLIYLCVSFVHCYRV